MKVNTNVDIRLVEYLLSSNLDTLNSLTVTLTDHSRYGEDPGATYFGELLARFPPWQTAVS